jgi:hypothetical protein
VRAGVVISVAMFTNMFVARIPALYIHANNMANPSTDVLWSYSSAMLGTICVGGSMCGAVFG